MKLPLFILMLCFGLMPWLAFAEKLKPLRLEIVIRKNSPLGQQIAQSFDRVLRRHGFILSLEEFPSQRGIQEMRRNRVDGTIGRVGDLEKIHGLKDYVRLNVPLLAYSVILRCSKTRTDMLSLKEPRIAYFPGNIFAMRTVQMINDPSVKVAEITSSANLVKMIQTGRLDCLIASDTIMDKVGVKPETFNGFFRHTLIAAPAYPWIARKYEHLVEVLDKELLAEQQDGPLHGWEQDWKTSCPIEFNVICPDGRLFTQPLPMPNQIWQSMQGALESP